MAGFIRASSAWLRRRAVAAWDTARIESIVYLVVTIEIGRCFVFASYPDVYHLGSATVHTALVAMAATGLDTTAVSRNVLARAARDAHRAAVGMSLDSLIAR
ncbi:MAG TPA: hypothetical protein VH539_17925 [Gemmatimonadaceae bacterium]